MHPLRDYLVALCCFIATASTSAIGQTLDEARQLHMAGEYEAAIEAYQQTAEKLASEDPAAAATAYNNSCVIFNGLGRFEEARISCEQALQLRRQLDDDRRLARTLNNYALALQNLGDYGSAHTLLLEALELNERRQEVQAEVLNLANLGALATISGNYGRALEFHARAEELAHEHREQAWAQEQLQIAIANRGVVLERLGAYREALELYRGLAEGNLAGVDRRRRAQIKLNMGVIYRNLGDSARAVQEFEGVASLYREIEDPDGLSNALLNLALAYHLNLGDWPRAEFAYREALELASRHGDRPEEIQDLFYLGQFLLDRGRLEEAEQILLRCLEASEASGSAEGRWSALAGLGRIAAARGDLDQAVDRFDEASNEIELVATGLSTSRLLSGFYGEKRFLYAAAVQSLADLAQREPEAGHADRALEFVQRAKARALLDALGSLEWGSQPLTVEALQESAEGGPVLEFFVAERDLLRWTIRANGIRMDNLGPAQPIIEKISLLYRQLSDGDKPPKALLRQVSSAILDGVDLSSAPTLHIALDHSLYRLPISLLPTPNATEESIVDRVSVSYLSSASALSWLRERSRREARTRPSSLMALGVGSPDIASLRQQSDTPTGLFIRRYGLEPLHAIEQELDTLQHHLPGQHELLTGADATESSFRHALERTARVTHIASHAVIDERPGRGASVLLAPDEEHDGLLGPQEIAGLDHRSALTVLAACQTAGDLADGAALTTLAGSFLAAGSSAVVATLWNVGDQATAAFMDQFYYQLGRGAAPAAALREAKRRLRNDARWSHPHLWAGYVLLGEASAIVPARRSSARTVAVFAVLLGVVLLALWWRRRERV
jgi:CHAT domain-containing protein